MIFQEFYCTISGGGCGGYFRVKLNDKLNGVVEVVCPKCGHKHQRTIVDGEIRETGRYGSSPVQEIRTTLSAWSEKPLAPKPKQTERDSNVIARNDDFLRELWFELHAEVGGVD